MLIAQVSVTAKMVPLVIQLMGSAVANLDSQGTPVLRHAHLENMACTVAKSASAGNTHVTGKLGSASALLERAGIIVLCHVIPANTESVVSRYVSATMAAAVTSSVGTVAALLVGWDQLVKKRTILS